MLGNRMQTAVICVKVTHFVKIRRAKSQSDFEWDLRLWKVIRKWWSLQLSNFALNTSILPDLFCSVSFYTGLVLFFLTLFPCRSLQDKWASTSTCHVASSVLHCWKQVFFVLQSARLFVCLCLYLHAHSSPLTDYEMVIE